MVCVFALFRSIVVPAIIVVKVHLLSVIVGQSDLNRAGKAIFLAFLGVCVRWSAIFLKAHG